MRTLAGYDVRKGDRSTAEPLYQKLVEVGPERGEPAALRRLPRRSTAHATPRPRRPSEGDRDREADEESADASSALASFYYARERYDEAVKMLKDGIRSARTTSI